MSRKKKHAPSAYRAILRRAKKVEGEDDREILALMKEAKELDEPYYSSLALLSLSSDPRLKSDEAVSAAEEGIAKINEVSRKWRRGELITAEAKELGRWRSNDTLPETKQKRDLLYSKLLETISVMQPGKGLSDAIKGAVKYFPGRHFEGFIRLAFSDRGFVQGDLKSIIRSWASLDVPDKGTPSCHEMISLLGELRDNAVASRSFGYLHLQMKKKAMGGSDDDPFEEAVRSALSIIDDETRLESLRYLATVTDEDGELARLAAGADSFSRPDHAARLFATLGGRAHRVSSEKAREWFLQGIQTASEVTDARERAAVRLNLAEGLSRGGMTEKAREVFLLALADCDLISKGGMKIPWRDKIERIVGGLGMELPKEFSRHDNKGKPGSTPGTVGIPKNGGSASSEPVGKADLSEGGMDGHKGGEKHQPVTTSGRRHVLALYNTYQGGLKPVHLRAISRAAPLCYAYELDIALLGFPSDDLPALVREVITETNIGKGGKYLRELVSNGRVLLISLENIGTMEDPDERGLIIATTSHPDRGKLITSEKALEIAKENHQCLYLVMGLGKKGLPPSFLNTARYHLELTGKNVSLETCTVMGIIAERLRGR